MPDLFKRRTACGWAVVAAGGKRTPALPLAALQPGEVLEGGRGL